MNKMFKKLMAVTATLAIAATMSVSAFAEGETEETTPATPSASHTAGSVEVKNYKKPDTAVDGTTQYTVMVFLDSEDGISADEIYYINQGSDPSTLLADMRVKATTAEDGTTSINLPDGDYTVRIGNSTGSVVNIDLKVVVEEDNSITVVWGDITGDGAVDGSDAIAAYLKLAQKAVTYKNADDVEITLGAEVKLVDFKDADGNPVVATFGDITGDGAVDGSDAIAAYLKLAQKAVTYNDSANNIEIALGTEVKINIK